MRTRYKVSLVKPADLADKAETVEIVAASTHHAAEAYVKRYAPRILFDRNRAATVQVTPVAVDAPVRLLVEFDFVAVTIKKPGGFPAPRGLTRRTKE